MDWLGPLPSSECERGGGNTPLRRLEQYLRKTTHRTFDRGRKRGRRESLLELLRDHRIELPAIDSPGLADSDHQRAIVVAPWLAASSGKTRTAWTRPPGAHHRRQNCLMQPRPRRRRKAEQATDVDSLIKDLSELNVAIRWCMPTMASGATKV